MPSSDRLLQRSRAGVCRVLIVPVLLLLTGCGLNREAPPRPLSISLNMGTMTWLVNTAQRPDASGESRLRLDAVHIEAFVPPNIVRIAGRHAGAKQNSAPDFYDIAFTQDNHIARAELLTSTQRGLAVNSPDAQKFALALSRALTTYALKDHSDGGIADVYVANESLNVEVQAPLR